MLYREIIAVCSQIHTKHINTLCGQNLELFNVKLAIHIVTNDRHCCVTLCCVSPSVSLSVRVTSRSAVIRPANVLFP